MTTHKVETISIEQLKQLANKKGKLRQAAQRALTEALNKDGKGLLGSITIDRELRQIAVHSN